MPGLSLHVVDVARGAPAQGMRVEVFHGATRIAEGHLGANGTLDLPIVDATLAPGTYEYGLVVDGNWMTAPHARESVPNPFGGRNSILRVATSPEAAHLADAENIPLKIDRFSESITGDHLIAEKNLP